MIHPALFGERLGRNARYAAAGNAFAAGLMGVCGSYFSDRAVFFLTAAFCVPALAALAPIRGQDLDLQGRVTLVDGLSCQYRHLTVGQRHCSLACPIRGRRSSHPLPRPGGGRVR